MKLTTPTKLLCTFYKQQYTFYSNVADISSYKIVTLPYNHQYDNTCRTNGISEYKSKIKNSKYFLQIKVITTYAIRERQTDDISFYFVLFSFSL